MVFFIVLAGATDGAMSRVVIASSSYDMLSLAGGILSLILIPIVIWNIEKKNKAKEDLMMKDITALDLEQKINTGEKMNIIDVRRADEIVKGKITGAKHIPLDEIKERTNELDKNEHYYMICTKGARSDAAAQELRQMGYKATNVTDGMLGWKGKVE